MATQKLRVVDRSAVFNLPWKVAQEEGYLAKEGLEVTFPLAEVLNQEREPGPREGSEELFSEWRLKERAFHIDSNIDAYNTCEWGGIKRTREGQLPGKIIGKRCSVVVMAIVASPKSKIYTLRDLAGVDIATSFYNGDHFVILELLGGALPRDQIRFFHATGGGYGHRLRSLLSGEYQAATVMEPYLSLAEKNGARIIAQSFFRGTEVASPQMDVQTIKKLLQALTKAVHKINEDPTQYVGRFLDEANQVDVPKKLRRQDFHLERLRFVEPDIYPEHEFRLTYDWMVNWDLVEPGARYEDLVRTDLVAAT